MKWVYLLLAIFSLNESNAQLGNNVYNIYAFYSVQGHGTIFVDPDEKVVDRRSSDTSFIIYVETGSRPPVWESAIRGSKIYSIKNAFIEKVPLEVGFDQLHHRKIILRTTDQHQLWRLVLLPEGEMKNPKYPRSKEFVIYGKYRKKPITIRVSRLVQLYSPDRP
jgi:hypothetical protein